ncbi:hypothetical protein [Secundilactobacillus odoratitofui]|nr:hypothetical protein [Secundilactobacillus odoratitofui]
MKTIIRQTVPIVLTSSMFAQSTSVAVAPEADWLAGGGSEK